MNKNEALFDMEKSILLFYNEMKWILASNRGKKFQFMMLERTFESLMFRSSQLRRKYIKDPPKIISPLDT
jgi:hypothetical protein